MLGQGIVANLGRPEIRYYFAIIDSSHINAYATPGGYVFITKGLIDECNNEAQLVGVLAHEMAHIKNRDILIGSVAAAVAMAISFVANMAQFAMIFGGGSRDRDRNPLVDLLLIIVAPIAAALIQMAISRSREFQADRTAARMIGDGEPLAAALEKLDVASRSIPSLANANQAQMYIANPLAGRQMAFRNLFTTHPPMDKRISRLRDGSWRDGI